MDRDTQRSHVSMGMQTGVTEGSTSQGTPRIASKPPAAGRGTEGQPRDTLMLNFWPPDLGGNTFLLSEAILRVVIRHPSPRSTCAQALGTDLGAELREAYGARDTDSLPKTLPQSSPQQGAPGKYLPTRAPGPHVCVYWKNRRYRLGSQTQHLFDKRGSEAGGAGAGAQKPDLVHGRGAMKWASIARSCRAVPPRRTGSPCDPAIPMLGLHPKEPEAGTPTGTHPQPLFAAAGVTAAKTGKHPRCPPADEGHTAGSVHALDTTRP